MVSRGRNSETDLPDPSSSKDSTLWVMALYGQVFTSAIGTKKDPRLTDQGSL
jgi:hypothetical protein